MTKVQSTMQQSPGIFATIGDKVSRATHFVGNGAKQISNSVGDLFSRVWTAVKNIFGMLAGLIANACNKSKDGIFAGVNYVKTNVTSRDLSFAGIGAGIATLGTAAACRFCRNGQSAAPGGAVNAQMATSAPAAFSTPTVSATAQTSTVQG